MRGALNIYRLSGLRENVSYWTAESNTLTNTRAANFIISKINMLLAELDYGEGKKSDTMNCIDVMCISLEALRRCKRDEWALLCAGSTIQEMIDEGEFECESEDDDERTEHLEALEREFTERFDETCATTGKFTAWWEKNIVSNNYNSGYNAAQRFEEYKREQRINGVTNPGDYEDLAEYVYKSGQYFLYLFIGDEEIKRYNATIRKRYRKEKEMYEYVCLQCKGVYTADTVFDMLYSGCTNEYKMTPKAKIEQLQKLGKGYTADGGEIGELVVILTAISLVIGIVATLIGIITTIFQYVVSVPDDEELGVPNPDDWNIGEYKNKGTGSENLTAMPILIGGAALLLLMGDDKKGKKKKKNK